MPLTSCYLDSFNYIKSGWVNRNRLLVVGGGPAYFTVPLSTAAHLRRFGYQALGPPRLAPKLLSTWL